MLRRVQENLQRRTIQSLAIELVPKPDDKINWVSPLVGRFILENVTNEVPVPNKKFTPPYFSMTVGLRMSAQTGCYPMQKIIFTGRGWIAGVIRSFVESEAGVDDKVVASVDFQIAEGLTMPTQSDYDDLERYLRLGRQDHVGV